MKGCFSTLLAIFTVILTAVTLIAFSIRYTLLSPMFVKKQLVEANFYSVFAEDILGDMMADSVANISEQSEEDQTETSDETVPFEYTDEEINEIASNVISAEWLQTNVEGALDEMDAFLKYEKDLPNVSIDLSSIKENIVSAVVDLTEDKYNELPICTEDQQQQMDQSTSDEMPDCRIEDVTFDELADEMGEDFDFEGQIQESMGEDFPDEFNLLDPESWSFGSKEDGQQETGVDAEQKVEDIKQSLLNFRDKYKLATTLMYVGTLIIVVLCTGLILVNLKNLRTGFKWAGIPLIISGLFVLVSAFVTGALMSRLLTAQIPTDTAEIPAEMINQITSLIGSIVQGILGKFKTLSIIPLALGVLLTGLSFIFKKGDKKKETPPAQQPQQSTPPPSPPQTSKNDT